MSIRLIAGDCRDVLPTLAAGSVQCVVTSPPYYGLRDYGTALWDGGDAACDHTDTSFGKGRGAGVWFDGGKPRELEGGRPQPGRSCARCGAVRVDRQIGLESSPSEYLATMVAVFREVRRVLRPDGTCWVNMGDSYAHSSSGGECVLSGIRTDPRSGGAARGRVAGANTMARGLKPKDLLLMPARLALALQADGWWVRSDIIWHKPNPMPESCTDRPTSAHEHVFLLTRSARYFYDNDAIREPYNEASIGRYATPLMGTAPAGRQPGGDVDRREREKGIRDPNPAGRSCRNVWTIATSPFSAAHFATFPPELAERCIRAGTSERGCCAACGKPWARVTDKAFVPQPDVSLARGVRLETQHDAANQWPGTPRGSTSATTTGWQPGCDHGAEVVPCTVLDPFAGAGTTLLVADRLQRDAIGIELNTAYTEMAMERCRADAPLFADMHPPPAEDPEDERMRDLFAEATE